MKKLSLVIVFVFISQSFFAQEKAIIIESNNKFSFDIYQKLRKLDENIIFSPASITSAIAMTYIGARNNTFNEIANTFHFNSDINEFSKDYSNLLKIDKFGKSKLQLFNANSLWIQKNLVLKSDFLNTNKQNFTSSLHQTDFIKESELSRLEINDWVENNTNKKIKDLIQPNTINSTTRLIIVNAIYFKDAWLEKFEKEDNSTDNFQTSKKEYVKTTFMNRFINSWYYEDKYTQIIDIPYSNRNVSLMIIVPKSYKKLKKIDKKINYEYYTNYTQNKKMKRINLSLPKFEIESEYNLKKTLIALGMKEAFTSKADFSGITNYEKLYISQVMHKANISIDEEGTEASAATAVLMQKTSFSSNEVRVNINKPFIYILRNNENNSIYFMGRIKKPN